MTIVKKTCWQHFPQTSKSSSPTRNDAQRPWPGHMARLLGITARQIASGHLLGLNHFSLKKGKQSGEGSLKNATFFRANVYPPRNRQLYSHTYRHTYNARVGDKINNKLATVMSPTATTTTTTPVWGGNYLTLNDLVVTWDGESGLNCVNKCFWEDLGKGKLPKECYLLSV